MGVILAAGKGVRMQPFSAHLPKPLLPVLNRPLIEHHLELMQNTGITDVVVVIGTPGTPGTLGADIETALAGWAARGVNIRFVEQSRPQGIAHAVGAVEPVVDRPFLLLLGDVYFTPRDLPRMFAMLDEGYGAVLAAVEEPDPEAIRRNFAVILGPDGRVTRVIEKPHHPPTRLKGCGVYLFDVSFFDAIRRTPRSALRDEYEITDAIQVFIDDGYRVGVAEGVADDVNLTHPSDIWALNLRELDRLGERALVHPSAVVDPGAEITRAVVGAGAKVGPVRLEDALVFPDAVVDADARTCVVTPHGRVAIEAPQ